MSSLSLVKTSKSAVNQYFSARESNNQESASCFMAADCMLTQRHAGNSAIGGNDQEVSVDAE